MAVLTGKTPTGLPYPIPNIDVFKPAEALKEIVEAVEVPASFPTIEEANSWGNSYGHPGQVVAINGKPYVWEK